MTTYPGLATIDLDAIAANVACAAERTGAPVMMVVKADGYGHGAVPSARAAIRGGAQWLGVAQLCEALEVLRHVRGTPMLAWLYQPDDDLKEALTASIDLSVGSSTQLEQVADAARRGGQRARVHLKIDTGLGRNGCPPQHWPGLIERAVQLVGEGLIEPVGVWTHMAFADAPDHDSVREQHQVFDDAVRHARSSGFDAQLAHLANSAATFTDPGPYRDIVRPGLAAYGLSPIPDIASAEDLGLSPAMRLTARVAMVKDVPAGQGVSYGLTYRTATATRLALVPLGYADGIPRHASDAAPVQINGQRARVCGRVCMDQFVVDLAGIRGDVAAGDEVVLFGGGAGEPTAQQWAEASGTISYEIVTRLGARVPKKYISSDPSECHAAR